MKYYHLTTPQKNIWNSQKYYEDTAISNLCGAIFYDENKDENLLKKAIEQYIKNNEGIRTRFCEEDEPKQYIEDEVDDNIPVMKFSSMKELDNYALDFAKKPIGLVNTTMYRFMIFQVENQSGILAVLSHLISDAWTFSLMAKQVSQNYENLLGNPENSDIKPSYINYIQAEDDYFLSERYNKDKKYWQEKITTCPDKTLVKIDTENSKNIEVKRITRILSVSLKQTIEKYCADSSLTPAVIFETALISYLSRINDENKDIIIGVPVLNRVNIYEKQISGMFVSTMPLIVKIDENSRLYDIEERIKSEHMNIFRHQKYPYADILKYVRENYNYAGNLYDVMLSFQNATTDIKAKTKWYSNGYGEAPLTINIDNRDELNSYTINVDYQIKVFNTDQEVLFLIKRLENILWQIVKDSNQLVKNISIIPDEEFETVINHYNNTQTENVDNQCVHDLFKEHVKKQPNKTALIFEDTTFSYDEIDKMSNSLANFLREKEVGVNDIIPIISKRSWHYIVAMLAILKAGGAYMPVDPNFPAERIDYMLEQVKPKIILEMGYTASKENAINLEEFNYEYCINEVSNINKPEDCCYVLFTSGSTGKPKAAMLCHKNLVNFVSCNQISNKYQCALTQYGKVVLADAAFTFDISVYEIYMSLLNGMTVVLTKESSDVISIAKLIEKYSIDVIHTTPTKIFMMLQNEKFQSALANVKILMIGAEVFSEELYCTIARYTDAVIYNGYGPTETTIGCCFKRIDEKNKNDITIGSPTANVQIYILDKTGRPSPIGVQGELCVAGRGVGKGYLNRLELTSEKFVENPYATKDNQHGKILYHTGDLARWRSDGEIEYLGRIDTQVKIRGLRIELGEVESVIKSFEGIGLAAVTDKKALDGRQYLVGYYTANEEIDERELRNHLLLKLPQYMVPNYFLLLSQMPITSSGKIDRKRLPIPDFSVQQREYIKPETQTEKKLASIWENLLHISKIGKKEDFFEIGGDSLLVLTMIGKIEESFNVTVGVKNIINNATLEKLAAYIETATEVERIPVTGKKVYTLLPQQRAIYAVYSKNPESLMYNMPARIVLPERIDIKKLKESIRKAIGHHKILTSHIELNSDEVVGVYDEDITIKFDEWMEHEEQFVRPFDLSQAPLIRIGFIDRTLLFDMHHIVADGETLNIILRDIVNEYEGKKVNDETVTYADYANYIWHKDMSEHKSFYKQNLKGNFAPVDLPKTVKGDKKGKIYNFKIDRTVVAEVVEYAKKNNLTDTMIYFAAYTLLLSKYSNQENILSSIILKNRMHADTQNMAGMFVNTLPIYVNVTGSILQYMQGIRNLMLSLFEYQELPFATITDVVGMEDKSAVNTSFVYQADGMKTLNIDGIKVMPEPFDTQTSKFDLMMEIIPDENNVNVKLEYNCEKYDEKLMKRLAVSYFEILKQLHKDNIQDVNVLSMEESKKLLIDFNDTAINNSKGKCIHELFKIQAKETPAQIALVFEDKKITYEQLDKMSNALAHLLRERNVCVNEVVPIISKRSWHVVVAMLGILKAGAAYMPIAPDYPNDRINNILEIANSKIALVFGYEEKLTVDCLKLDEIDFENECSDVENLNSEDDSAYVIFTSGSTGQPKGITVTHNNVCNYASNCSKNIVFDNIMKRGYKSIVSVTNIIFDIFVTESIFPLLNGLCIYFANDEQVVTQEKLGMLIEKNHIEIMQTTPTKMRSYIMDKSNVAYLKELKVIILGGEAFPADLYNDIKMYSDAQIYNIYGPAETTVWSTNVEVTTSQIGIGSPIANTQIYILDKDEKLLPIGVAGELCIAGAGVGKGYLNRNKLTAEKFVKNPFATRENGHGKIMYHTGDLARWNDQGKIEYLGRIDTQVKIRGLRVELGEIESLMSCFSKIKLAAVTDKKDENGRQYLVGYYTTDDGIDEKELREFLASKLPQYMVPNYFLKLHEMPLTPSGKTDRKNLPVPDFSIHMNEYVAPETLEEKKLCELLEIILKVEKVGVTDDFFEYGGDSLAAIEYVAKAHNIGINISLQNVFDYTTVRKLCNHIKERQDEKVHYESEDFLKYKSIFERNIIENSIEFKKEPLGNVFLTGATGFLGAHVLNELLQTEKGKIYCLIRNGKANDSSVKLRDILKYYFGDRYESEINKRIIPIVGDIEKEGLADEIPTDVQTVIHTAASVKHYGSYTYFYKVNVEGTQHVINYAKTVGAKMIHISTLSVSGNSMADDFSVYRSKTEKHFYETSFYIGQPLDNVYIHSKFEAERKVYDAMLEGLDAKVIRVGNLTNRVSDYKFQPNYTSNAFLNRVKAILEFGLFPDYLISMYAEFSPVDKTAEGIVKIAQYADKQCVFHLNSDKVIYFDRFLEIVHKLGISMKVVSGTEFSRVLQETIKQSNTEYIFETFQNDMDEKGHLVYDSNIHIGNDFTLWFLKKIGFEWNETDMEYIRGYIDYFHEIGYFGGVA